MSLLNFLVTVTTTSFQPINNWGFIIISLITLTYGFELIIQILNYLNRKQPIPNNVKDIYDTEKYNKWLEYNMENFRFGLISQTASTLIIILLLALGFFGVLEQSLTTLGYRGVLANLLFLFGYFVLTFIINLPFRYYRTFVIEQKFGFNKTTKQLFVTDIIKNFVITIAFGGAIIGGLNLIFNLVTDIWLFAGLAFALISIIMLVLFLFNGVFVRWFNKLTILPDGSLKTKIDELGKRLGFEVKRIFVMDASKRSTKLNAFFTGLGKTREVVLFDTLIAKSTEEQILAVLAHELGHATYKDTTRAFLQQLIVIGIYVLTLGFILTNPLIATAFGLSGVHFGFTIIMMFILLEPVNIIIGIPLNYISRFAEYRADAFAKKHTSKEAMVGALRVLAVENFANLVPHPLYVFLNYSHPPLALRLKALD
jgi:STE24 endopeptidase